MSHVEELQVYRNYAARIGQVLKDCKGEGLDYESVVLWTLCCLSSTDDIAAQDTVDAILRGRKDSEITRLDKLYGSEEPT